MATRTEQDSMGQLEVPVDALYGAQTQRAVNNFPISDLKMPRPFIKALGLIKQAAAKVNADLGLLDKAFANAIITATDAIIAGKLDAQFPVDVFQTGSGTSSNMNINEVIANVVKQQHDITIHPNDHVNLGQSSNDVIPTAIHLSASLELEAALKPALEHLATTLETKAKTFTKLTKTGRTHLMDAMPITLEQEIAAWASQIRDCLLRLEHNCSELNKLTLGGTAVGTGVNAHPEMNSRVCAYLSQQTKVKFSVKDNLFTGLSCQDPIVALSGQLRTLAVALLKIANDLRWMNSGPLAGISEISLPAVQPGSSIMPGKVNPVIAESVCMVAAQVIGNDATIAFAGSSGNFQLNVMLPVIAYNILQSIQILSNACYMLADSAISKFTVNSEQINTALEKNPILITALNAVIGYNKGAAIAKKAYAEKKPILEVATEMTDLSKAELEKLLDPYQLTQNKKLDHTKS